MRAKGEVQEAIRACEFSETSPESKESSLDLIGILNKIRKCMERMKNGEGFHPAGAESSHAGAEFSRAGADLSRAGADSYHAGAENESPIPPK